MEEYGGICPKHDCVDYHVIISLHMDIWSSEVDVADQLLKKGDLTLLTSIGLTKQSNRAMAQNKGEKSVWWEAGLSKPIL